MFYQTRIYRRYTDVNIVLRCSYASFVPPLITKEPNIMNIVRRKKPDFIIRGGKPVAVIIDIDEYQEILNILEDIEDSKELAGMRKKTSKFRDLDDFLNDKSPKRK